MVISLGTELYSDGMNIEMMDCVNIPIAAASGYYRSENYFYYALLFEIKNNWRRQGYICNLDFFEWIEELLNPLGLCIKKHHINNSEELITTLSEQMLHKIPVLLYVKYNALYYNKYFMDEGFSGKHMLLLNKWNDKTGIYTMCDSVYLREANVMAVDAEYLFPVCFQEEQVKKMWENSRKDTQFELCNYVYTIERCSDSTIDYVEILENMLAIGYKQSQFSQYAGKIGQVPIEDWSFNKTYFVGSIKGIYRILERWVKKEGITLKAWDDLQAYKETFIEQRNLRFSKLYKQALRQKDFSDEALKNMYQENEETDKIFFLLMEKFLLEYKKIKKVCEISIIDISSALNNEAIAPEPKMSCTADIAGTGLFFVLDNQNKPENIRLFLKQKTKDGVMDNISCNGQVITFKKGIYKKLILLACAEYGNYTEKILFYNEENLTYNARISFSDFFANPKFYEEKCYVGDTYYKENNEVRKQEFPAQIFKYDVLLNGEEIGRMILPIRKNVHIFGMYFEL